MKIPQKIVYHTVNGPNATSRKATNISFEHRLGEITISQYWYANNES